MMLIGPRNLSAGAILAAAVLCGWGLADDPPALPEKPEQTPAEQPAAEQPAAEQPAAEQPAAEQPAVNQPASAATSRPLGWTQKEMVIRMPVIVPEGAPAPVWPLHPPFPTPPAFGPQGFGIPPVAWPPLPPVITHAHVDPGSLRTHHRAIKDAAGQPWTVRERTWTSNGGLARDVQYVQGIQPRDEAEEPQANGQRPSNRQRSLLPGPNAAEAPQENLRESGEQRQPTEPSSEQTPANTRDADPQATAPSGIAGGLSVLKGHLARQRGPVAGVGVAVTSDSRNGVRLYEYFQGDGARPSAGVPQQRVQTPPTNSTTAPSNPARPQNQEAPQN